MAPVVQEAHSYVENTILNLFVFMFWQTSLTADSAQMKVIILYSVKSVIANSLHYM